MHVVVDVLARNGGRNGLALASAAFGTGVLELETLLFETSLDGGIVTVVLLALLDGGHLVNVFLRENFTVLDRLDRGVVVILVDLTVDGGGGLLMTVLGDVLLDYGRGDLLVHGGVIVTGLVPVVGVSVRCRGRGNKVTCALGYVGEAV